MQHVHDRVHGDVVLSGVVAHIANSPIFFRLDGIRQLGGCSWLYPSATHSRREHSLGVAHLAGVLAKRLREQRADLVSDKDVMCLQVAGLVHDLGHGPFSHTFEEYVRETDDAHWSHETMTLAMFGHICDTEPTVRTALSEDDRAFVRLLVTGLDRDAPWPSNTGRDERVRFLVDIVHNRTSGLDVDRMDYLARDALAVFGETHACDVMRILTAACIVETSNGAPRLAYRDTVALSIGNIFELRTRLHQQVYQHKRALVVEALLKDLMRAVDQEKEVGTRLIDVVHDPVQYSSLTDAAVLAYRAGCASERAYAALFTRPKRLPISVWLYTEPRCVACGGETRIEHMFCGRCGVTTRGRVGELVDGALVPVSARIGEREATLAVRRRMQDVAKDAPIDVRVLIMDVSCGVPTILVDPHGVAWHSFVAPLERVVFCDEMQQVSSPSQLPRSRHLRSATCVLPADASAAEVSSAQSAFRAWGATVGVVCDA